MRFVRSDAADLITLEDASYDVVHVSRHVCGWVSDLRAFFLEAVRVLKPAGLFFVTEYHPVRRVFKDDPAALVVERSYLDRGPFYQGVAEGLFNRRPGSIPSYVSHWTVADFYHAVSAAGCELLAFEEIGDGVEEWKVPPLAGFPQLLFLAARKRTS